MERITDYSLETTKWNTVHGWSAYFLRQWGNRYVFSVEVYENNILPQLAVVDEFGRTHSHATHAYISAKKD